MAEFIITKTFTGNGDSDIVEWRGGKGHFTAHGTFGSGTCKLQYRTDGTNWVDVGTDATFTSSGGIGIDLPPASIKINLAGATSPSILAKVTR